MKLIDGLTPEQYARLKAYQGIDNLAIMQSLSDTRTIIRNAQFGLANSSPIVWNMLQRTLKNIDAQQADTLSVIRNA